MIRLFFKFGLIVIILIKSIIGLSGQECDPVSIDSMRNLILNQELEYRVDLETYLHISSCFLSIDLDSASYYIDRGLERAQSLDDRSIIASLLVQKGHAQYSNGDQDQALIQLEEAIQFYEELEKDRDYLKAINISGLIYETRQDYEKALEYYLSGIQESQLQKDTLNTAFFHNNSANIYNIIGDTTNSIKQIKKAISIFKALNNQYYYSNALVNLGNSYLDAKKNELAKENLLKAESLQLGIGNHYGLFNNYANLGDLALQEADTNLAIEYYSKSLEQYKKCDTLDALLRYECAFLFLDLANINSLKFDYGQSIYYFRKVLQEGKEQNSPSLISRAYKGLSDCYNKMEIIDSAYHYLELYQPVHDSLISEIYNEKIDHINYEFQLEQQRKLIETEKDLIIVDRRNQRLNFFIIISLLLFLVALLVLVSYYHVNKLKQSKLRRKNLELERNQLQLNLDYKNKELTTSVLHLIERNEFINQLSEKLQASDENMETDKILDLVKQIEKNTSGNLWAEFEKTYMEVHKDFHMSLTSRYANLTANDRKLCAFILMNMSSKEISSITYQSPQSIKIARYRLRKKLGLTRSENLSAFLNQLESSSGKQY